MYFFINLRQSWNDVLPASAGVFQEFWLHHVDAFNGFPINRPLSSGAILTCEASASGLGAHVTFCTDHKFCSGMWSACECYNC